MVSKVHSTVGDPFYTHVLAAYRCQVTLCTTNKSIKEIIFINLSSSPALWGIYIWPHIWCHWWGQSWLLSSVSGCEPVSFSSWAWETVTTRRDSRTVCASVRTHAGPSSEKDFPARRESAMEIQYYSFCDVCCLLWMLSVNDESKHSQGFAQTFSVTNQHR